MFLNHLGVYIKYNFAFDLIFFALGCFGIIHSISNSKNNSTLLIMGIIFSGAIIAKVVFTIISTKKLIEKVKNSPIKYPESKDKEDFNILNVSVKERGDSLEIVKDHHLEALIKKPEIENFSKESYIVELKTTWWNWNSLRDTANGVNYYQIFLYDGERFKELLNIAEHEKINEPIRDSKNIERFSELGERMANILSLPIKKLHTT